MVPKPWAASLKFVKYERVRRNSRSYPFQNYDNEVLIYSFIL